MPVAILMAVMLYTGSKALQYLSVPIFTIFKNLSIILVAYGETRVFGGRVTSLMLGSFMLMASSHSISWVS
jgi:GDP-mannose transporter